MDAVNKKRKVLTETDVLSILESTEEELSKAAAALDQTSRETLLDGAFDAGIFDRLVKEKKLTASTIAVNEQPAFVLIHGFNAAGWLVIEGAVTIGRQPISRLFEGGYALARHLNAPWIVFVTKLSALYRYAAGHDFNDLGVILGKPTPPE